MATTSPDNLWSPDSVNPYNWTVDAAAMQTSVQAALTARPATYRTNLTNAQRIALSGGDLFEGLRVRTTDTDLEWLYTGTAWLLVENSSYIVIPTSVSGTGATLQTDGTINMSGSTSVTVNGAFTTRFRRYRLEFSIDTSTAEGDMIFALRNAGSAVGASAHSWVSTQIQNGVGPDRSQGVDGPSTRLGRIANAGGYCVLDFANPAHANTKMGNFSGTDSALYSRQGGTKISLIQAVDGFNFSTTNSASVTGRMRIQGMA